MDTTLAVQAAYQAGGRPSSDGLPRSVAAARDLIVGEAMDGNLSAVEFWAHSEGGAILALAVHHALLALRVLRGEPEPLRRLKIRTFGSAAPVWPDGPAYEHYVHLGDFTPVHLGVGADPGKGGKDAELIWFHSASPKDEAIFTDVPSSKPEPRWTLFHGFSDTYLRAYRNRCGGCPIQEDGV